MKSSFFSHFAIFFYPTMGIIPPDCAGIVFVFKAYPPIHIKKICAGACNAVGGRIDKQDGGNIFCPRPKGVIAQQTSP
jgi:hypothetical protein